MALPVWGNLEKSQSDSEKIEEAILRLITEHNDDETAHLGAGQSLQSHKAAEVIDHLAESIVEDKFAEGCVSSRAITSEQIVGKDFRTAADVGEEVDGVKFDSSGLEMWQGGEKKVDIPVSGNPLFRGKIEADAFSYVRDFLSGWFGSTSGWSIAGTKGYLCNGIYLTTSSTINTFASIDTGGDFDVLPGRDPFFDIKISLPSASLSNCIVSVLVGSSMTEAAGSDIGRLGFKIVNGVMYTLFQSGLTDYSEEVDGFEVVAGTQYRLTLDLKLGEYIRWYIDDVLVREETTDNVYEHPVGSDFECYIKTTVASSKQMNLRNCSVSANYQVS